MAEREVVLKLLGPTAEYLGEGLKNFTEASVHNLQRVVTAAVHKLGPGIENDGAIPPKALKIILEEAPFCDDELAAETQGANYQLLVFFANRFANE